MNISIPSHISSQVLLCFTDLFLIFSESDTFLFVSLILCKITKKITNSFFLR